MVLSGSTFRSSKNFFAYKFTHCHRMVHKTVDFVESLSVFVSTFRRSVHPLSFTSTQDGSGRTRWSFNVLSRPLTQVFFS